MLILPSLGAVFIVVTIPFILVVIQSISADDGTLIGLNNYARALGNPLLFDAIRATGVYSLIVLPEEWEETERLPGRLANHSSRR